jgi:Flp pilus assembly protein TadG
MFAAIRYLFNRSQQRQKGAATVEFALCLLPLMFLIAGVADYGELWYLKIVIANASREGARYAIRYQVDPTTGQRILPSNLSPSVATWVTTNYSSLLPDDANLSVTPGGAGYTSGTTGNDVQVTVNAQYYWMILSKFLPGLSNPQAISAVSIMKCE